jgi:hypothetical protein
MKKQDNNSNPNAGWNQREQWYLNGYDNAEAGPDVQILNEEGWENENKERREYFCAICQSKLDYLKNMDMWFCSAAAVL